ncbi:CapA family protein [Rhizobium leguminosarum]|uniref:Capsule synthesis protein CapA domain-containing protein n=2 Tax=Rhizobium leguminosarum TaxID=384 RepID=A0A154IMD9_RHILE|nr:CapA family protein [Rhizobium leguminosarum]KZB01754.1 hypothetical protein A4A59_11970 [Rhizobium leguminosarum]
MTEKKQTHEIGDRQTGSGSDFGPRPLKGQDHDGGGGNAMVEALPEFDWEKELATKIRGKFAMAAVGDLTMMRPFGPFADESLQAVLSIIRNADVGFANLESNISDPPNYTGPLRGFMGVKEVATDIKSWGINVVSKCANHGFDSGPEGMLATLRLLEDAGVQYAGSGRNLTEAQAARFFEIGHGRIGIAATYAVEEGTDATRAADAWGNYTASRAGQNTLRLTRTYNITQEQVDQLRTIQDSLYVLDEEITTLRKPPQPVSGPAASAINLNGTIYQAGGVAGTIDYIVNPEDLRQQFRQIKGGKQYADFMIASIHAHQAKWVAEAFPEETSTPQFLIDYAHAAVDQGADVFMGHGPHALRGIEIYRGRPIFYGLGQFVRQSDWRTPTRADFDAFQTTPETTPLTPAELGVLRTAGPGFRHRAMYQSIIAVSRYDDGQLQEIHIYPVDLGFDRPLSQVGNPTLANEKLARDVLEHMQRVSAPFGTEILIEGNVGVIRPSSR